MGEKAFRKIQFGRESVHGTQVAATAKILGTLTHKETPTIHLPEEHTGTLSKHHRVVKTGTQAEISRDGSLTFEQCVYYLLMGIRGGVIPSQINPPTGIAYRWSFEPDLTSKNNPDSFTIEYGDDVQSFYSTYCMAKSLEISGTIDDPLSLKADIFGQNFSKCDFTAGLALPVVEDALTNKTKLYIDDTGAGLGSTQKSKTLIDFSWKLETEIHPKKFCDGELWYTGHGEASRCVELDMTFEFNTTANSEFEAYDNQTKRFIQIQTDGSVIEDTTRKAVILKLCGVYTEWDTLDERDGNDIVKVKMVSVYDPTWAKEWLVEVVNDVATLP